MLKHKNLGLGLFYNAEGKVLLQNRSEMTKFNETWGFFGGSIEPGETVEEATKRELLEELEFVVKDMKHLNNYEEKALRTSGILQTASIDVFTILITKEEFNRMVLHEGSGMQWFTINEALELKMCPWDKKIINDFEVFLKKKK